MQDSVIYDLKNAFSHTTGSRAKPNHGAWPLLNHMQNAVKPKQ